MSIKKPSLIILFLLTYPGLILCQQAGNLDLTFDFDGKVVSPHGNIEDRAFAVTQQSDGKILIAGTTTGTSDRNSLVSRFNIDGTIDSTFGFNGHMVLDVQPGIDDYFNSIIVQPDGKLMLSGPSGMNPQFSINVVRLLANGTIDSSFSQNGIKNIQCNPSCHPNAMAQDSNGRTLIAGNGNGNIVLARLLPNGTEDSTFAGTGVLVTQLNTNVNKSASSLAIDSNDKYIIAGYSGASFYNYLFARFDSSGALDATFGQSGYVTFPISGFGGLNECTIQNDGKIIGVGSFDATGIGNNHDFVVIRINDDGVLDTTFAQSGIFELPVGSNRDILQSVEIQNDGKLLAFGYVDQNLSNSNFGLIRLNTDGSLDNTFGTNGLVITNFNGDLDVGSDLIIQSDSKILVCGWTFQNNVWKSALARYHSTTTVGFSDTNSITERPILFPNPTNKIINIKYSINSISSNSIQIFSIYGQEIDYTTYSVDQISHHTFQLDVSELANGLYYLLIDGNRLASRSFIKY